MTEKQLTDYSKETIVTMYMALQEITESLKKTSAMQQEQMNALNKKIDLLLEQVALANQRRFGRSSEKIVLEGQIELYFNEVEAIMDANESITEPELDEVYSKPTKRKKQKGNVKQILKTYRSRSSIMK